MARPRVGAVQTQGPQEWENKRALQTPKRPFGQGQFNEGTPNTGGLILAAPQKGPFYLERGGL